MAVVSKLADLDRALGDLARPSHFDVQLVLVGADVVPDVSLSAKQTTFPSVTQNTVTYSYQGQPINLKGQMKQDTQWSCTFHLTENHELKLFFEEWMSISSNNGLKISEEIRAKILAENFYNSVVIYQYPLDGSKNEYVKYTLYNVFPKGVSKLSVDHSSVGQTLSFDVDFSFSHYVVEQVGGKKQSKQMDKISEKLTAVANKALDKIFPNKPNIKNSIQSKTKIGIDKTKKLSKMVNPLL